jgi:hypothetical protein
MADSRESFILKLARETRSWKSIEILYRDDLINHVPIEQLGAGPNASSRNRYVETSSGNRLMEIKYYNGDTLIRRRESYFDGERGTNFLYKGLEGTPEVRIEKGFMGEDRTGSTRRPGCLVYLRVGKVPIDEALAQAQPLGIGKVIGRDVDLFLFPRTRWGMIVQDLVYSLDRETALPLKVEAYRTEQDRERGVFGWSWTARRFEFVQGHPIVMESEVDSYTVEKAGKPRVLAQTNRQAVDSIEFDRDYPITTFRPAVSGQSKVIDSIQKKITQPSPPPPRQAEIVEQPIRADAARDWSSIASASAVVLGVALLVSGLVVWFRREAR